MPEFTGPLVDPQVNAVIARLNATRRQPPLGAAYKPGVERDPHAYAEYGLSIHREQGELIYLLCRAIRATRVAEFARSLAECSSHLKRFVLGFERGVKARFGSSEKPIKNLTIVCHSMGGMVCTDALRDSSFSGLGFHAIVTIATPFYGTSTHQERYYKGISILNIFYGAKTVVRIVASLPGPFTLMFLPKAIYNRDKNRLGLSRYPQYDPNGNVDTDPYDLSLLSRWTPPVQAHKAYLTQAKNEMIRVADPINSNIAPVFFNVRSMRNATTAIELLWNNVNGSTFDPKNDPSPLAGVAGPGDGTVPAWSAWHAYSRPSNQHNLRQASDHGKLLEHPEVLELIKTVVDTRMLPLRRKRVAKPVSVAGKRKVLDVVEAWAKRAERNLAPPKELFEKPVARGIANQLIAGDKPRMVRRPSKLSRKARKKR